MKRMKKSFVILFMAACFTALLASQDLKSNIIQPSHVSSSGGNSSLGILSVTMPSKAATSTVNERLMFQPSNVSSSGGNSSLGILSVTIPSKAECQDVPEKVFPGRPMFILRLDKLIISMLVHFRPKTATFEHVPGLVLDDYKGYLQSVVSSILQMGYQVRSKVLTSSSYGDPQKRRRLILMVARSDCRLPDMPPPTHGTGLLPIKTCKDALQMFEQHDPTSSKSSGTVFIDETVVFNHIIPGHKHDQDNDFELIEDEPSRTILARARPHRHYSGKRFISVREAACLQSFPVSYRFFGRISHQYAQIGNAVPVKLATAIARSVAIVHGCAV
ncbi:hypothetical protein ACHAXR_010727 [Thalassiosira sp. AJA248-18]